jgi:tryptophan-rich sensory protein
LSPPAITTVERAPGVPAAPSRRSGLVDALIAGASVVATSTAGRLITAKPVKSWYPTLAKPWFNPPNWAFPLAWSTLFLLMGIAFWRVLHRPAETPRRSLAIALFLSQLVVNVGWSTAFFGANSPTLGMIVIVPFLALIVATARVMGKIDRAAGWLLAPYIAWVSFATVLNAAIVHLN